MKLHTQVYAILSNRDKANFNYFIFMVFVTFAVATGEGGRGSGRSH